MRVFITNRFAELRKAQPLVVTLFILAVVGMNLLANKSIDFPVSWLALDCGTLFSWLTFLSMDVLNHCYGRRLTNTVSVIAIGCNLLMAGIFFLASLIPGTWSQSYVPGSEETINKALDATFAGNYFIILGSAFAFMVSALLNNFFFEKIEKRLSVKEGFKSFAFTAYISTFFGQMADNYIFTLIVSRTLFGWTILQCLVCGLTTALIEVFLEIVFSPLGYRLAKKLTDEELKLE